MDACYLHNLHNLHASLVRIFQLVYCFCWLNAALSPAFYQLKKMKFALTLAISCSLIVVICCIKPDPPFTEEQQECIRRESLERREAIVDDCELGEGWSSLKNITDLVNCNPYYNTMYVPFKLTWNIPRRRIQLIAVTLQNETKNKCSSLGPPNTSRWSDIPLKLWH